MIEGKMMGPVDYLMIRFPGNKFSGKAAPEVERLQKEGIIQVIDLVLISKDENGKLVTLDPAALGPEVATAFNDLTKNIREWFSEGDIEVIAESLPTNSSAVLLLYENVWARKFKEDLFEMDAELIDMGRIPPENVEKVAKTLPRGGA